MIHLKDFRNFLAINESSIYVEKMDPASYENITVTSLPYSDMIGENRNPFLKKIVMISKDLGIDPKWILHTIYNESEFDPKKVNPGTGAVGLLSFLPQVLKYLTNKETGKTYTPNDVLEMSNVDQLDLIKAFYKSWIDYMKIKKPIAPGDFASLTFYPGVIKKDWEWEFPDFVIERNPDLFKSFASATTKNKKDYYEYIESILNSEKDFDSTNGSFLGDFSGAIADPVSYGMKKPLEFYKELLLSLEDPNAAQQIQAQDEENTEKSKQVDK